MYDFNICYITTLVNEMTSGNGSLSLYLTMATVKDTEKEAFGKALLEKEKMLDTSIFSFSKDAFYPMTDCTMHVAYNFWSENAFNLTNLEFYGIVKSLCKTVVTYKSVQKYVSDPYQSLSSIIWLIGSNVPRPPRRPSG